MDHLWSPWRSVHINKHAGHEADNPDPVSVFTRLHEQKHDEENLILWRGDSVFVIMNLYPYNNGHLMVVPYREVADYAALSVAEITELGLVLKRCIQVLKQALSPDGFNVGMNLGKAAGAGIPRHLHMHIVPRWDGDTNFMPTLAETKVIPEALRDSYKKIKTAWARLDLSDPDMLSKNLDGRIS
ncbi:MAG: HIT domain-containing protein [Bacteroidota bacterium]